MTGERCGSCIWRAAENVPWRCDFAVKTMQTRRAEKAAECTWYQRGGAVADEDIAGALKMAEARRARRGLT